MKKKCRYPKKFAGTLIKTYREKMKLTQLEVAKNLGYQSMQFISDIERGLKLPPKKIIPRLTKMLRMPKRGIDQVIIKDQVYAITGKNTAFLSRLFEDSGDKTAIAD